MARSITSAIPRRAASVIVVFALAITIGVSAMAEESEHEHDSPRSHPNEVGLFLGITTGGEHEGDGKEQGTGTIGIEYERRLSGLIGLGILLEFVGGERRDHVGIVPLAFRPTEHTRFVLGAGWERMNGTALFSGTTKAVLRVGFSYSFEVVPNNIIAPSINVDFVDGEELIVVGAAIGWGF